MSYLDDPYADESAPDLRSDPSLLKGIDVSSWQHDINWADVPSEIGFVYVRASVGITPDERAKENVLGARATGRRVGVYHYLKHTIDAEHQLDTFVQALRDIGIVSESFTAIVDNAALPWLAPVLDVEEGDGPDVARNALAFLHGLEDMFNLRAIVYTMPDFANRELAHCADFAEYDPWIAHWGAKSPTVPEPWSSRGRTWIMWQHDNRGRLPGVRGDVDLNVARTLR